MLDTSVRDLTRDQNMLTYFHSVIYTYSKFHESEYATKKNLCLRVDEKK